MDEKEFMLEIGDEYSIRIADEDDTAGIFRGYCAFGEDTAIVIEKKDGGVRFIPVAQIVFIDVISAKGGRRISKLPDVNYV